MDYRIDELAEAAGTTARNIRAYQDRGLLPPPRREGRVAWYSDEHLARLRVIATLLERGYSLGNIAELIEAWQTGGELRDLLGFEAAVTSPFTDEAPSSLGVAELAELFGTIDPMAVAKAVSIGLLQVEGAGFKVPSMRLLRAGAELHRAGIPLDALLDEIAALRRDVDRVASRFVDLVVRHVFDRQGDALPKGRDAAALADMLRRVRPLAELAVDVELARSLEKHIKERLGERMGRLLDRAPRRRQAKLHRTMAR